MITLLEMHDRPTLAFTRPRRSGMLLRLDEPSVGFYRHLHDRAGTAAGRGRLEEMGDEEVFSHLQEPAVEVFVLFLGGAPAGFFELDRGEPGTTRVVHVGLTPEFQGRGLGKYLVAAAVETAWDEAPERVWTSVDGDEDPRGLLLYQWAGFVPAETRDGDA
jgi:GNAT superfamily N-acetyltransferase